MKRTLFIGNTRVTFDTIETVDFSSKGFLIKSTGRSIWGWCIGLFKNKIV